MSWFNYSEYPIIYVKEHKIIIPFEEEISSCYRSLIPKYYKVNKQKYPAHISVVRNEIDLFEIESNLISFEYENVIYDNGFYFWLRVRSDDLFNLRRNLGLNKTSLITKSPDQQHDFHITIGNMKETK